MSASRESVPLAYLITFTTYGARLHGDARGSVDEYHNELGGPFVPPNARLVRLNAESMRYPPYLLQTEEHRQVVIQAVTSASRKRRDQLVAAQSRTNHVHVVTRSNCSDPRRLTQVLKQTASRHLRRAGCDVHPHRWARGGSSRYIWTTESLDRAIDYVLNEQGSRMSFHVHPEYQHLLRDGNQQSRPR